MSLGRVPTEALRIIAGEAGVVGSLSVLNGVLLPAALLAKTCGAELQHRITHHESVELIYEVLRVKRNRPLFLKEHIDRIQTSMSLSTSVTQYHTPWKNDSAHLGSTAGVVQEATTEDEVARALEYCPGEEDSPTVTLPKVIGEKTMELVTAHPGLEQNIKIIVFAGPFQHHNSGSPRLCLSFAIFFVRAFYPPPEKYNQGILLSLLRDAHRDAPNAKIVQARLRERAAEHQRRTGAFEVLLCHSDGLVPEGSRSNFFIVDQDGAVHMSLDSDVLIGITRMVVERCCAQAGIKVVKRRLYETDVMSATAMAMTGTSVGVLPVNFVDNHALQSTSNEVLKKIMLLYEEAAMKQ